MVPTRGGRPLGQENARPQDHGPRPATRLDLVLRRVPARPSRWHSYQSLPRVFLIGERGGGSPRVVAAMTRPSGEGDYWIAATAVWTFFCSSLGSGAYPRSGSFCCASGEEK